MPTNENCKLNFWIGSVFLPTTKHRSSWAIVAILISRLLQLECSIIRCAISRLQLAPCKITIPRLSRCIQNFSRFLVTPLIDYRSPVMPKAVKYSQDFPGYFRKRLLQVQGTSAWLQRVRHACCCLLSHGFKHFKMTLLHLLREWIVHVRQREVS